MTVEWLAEQLKEQNNQLTQTQKQLQTYDPLLVEGTKNAI